MVLLCFEAFYANEQEGNFLYFEVRLYNNEQSSTTICSPVCVMANIDCFCFVFHFVVHPLGLMAVRRTTVFEFCCVGSLVYSWLMFRSFLCKRTGREFFEL